MADVRLRLGEADGRLPDVCMCCGEAASDTNRRNMTWTPPWVGILILAGWLPYIIVAAIMSKTATVHVPLCERHQSHWLNRNLIIWGSFVLFLLIGVAGFVVAASLPGRDGENVFPFVCLGSVVFFVIWLVITVVCQSTAIRPKEITDEDITISGVCEEFIEAVDEARAERRARKRARRREEDEEDDEPRSRRRRDEEDEEEERPRSKRRREEDEAIQEEPRVKKRRKPPSDEIEE
jgi:hypothetical protein